MVEKKNKIVKCHGWSDSRRCRKVARYFCKEEKHHYCDQHAVPKCCKLLIPANKMMVSRLKLVRILNLIQYPIGKYEPKPSIRQAIKLLGGILNK